MKENKHRTIHLHVYERKQGVSGIAYNDNQKVINRNSLVKLTHNTKEWDMYMKLLKINGFVKVEVKGFLIDKKDSDGNLILNEDGSFKYDTVPESVTNEVKVALHGTEEIKLTPEQKEIKELKEQMAKQSEQMAELLKGKQVGGFIDKSEEEQLKDARDDYERLFGEKGHHKWILSTILDKIENKKNELLNIES